MSDLLLVLSAIHVREDDQAVPLGAACVASAVKADAALSGRVRAVVLDSFPAEGAKALADRIAALKPDLAGFSVYLWNREASIGAARRLRALLPDAVLFAGGADATARPAGLTLEDGGPFDFAVAGEGEAAVPAALRALLEGGDFSGIPGVFARGVPEGSCAERAPLIDPASLPSPWLDGTLEPRRGRGVLWELARGCPYACSYCYESKGERKLRRIPQARLEAELARFVEAGTASAFVLDPTFNADKERARVLLDLLAEKAPDMHFHFEVRAESLDRGLAKRFADMKASLQIGLQTARPEIAAKVDRKLDRGLFASKISLLNEEGAVFGLDLIYGLPGDDLGGFRGSLDYALGLFPNNLDVFRLAVLPGTALADQAPGFGMDWDQETPYLVRSTPSFNSADLKTAEGLAKAVDLFYNRGRAVGWFNQVLHPLSEKASYFLEGFASFASTRPAPDPADPNGIERLQLGYLDARFESAGLDYLLPAVWDVVRFHAAWARAVAEGIETDLVFNYDPDAVLSPDAQDLEEFAALAEMESVPARIVCGGAGPELHIR